jgi:hypothetical protein
MMIKYAVDDDSIKEKNENERLSEQENRDGVIITNSELNEQQLRRKKRRNHHEHGLKKNVFGLHQQHLDGDERTKKIMKVDSFFTTNIALVEDRNTITNTATTATTTTTTTISDDDRGEQRRENEKVSSLSLSSPSKRRRTGNNNADDADEIEQQQQQQQTQEQNRKDNSNMNSNVVVVVNNNNNNNNNNNVIGEGSSTARQTKSLSVLCHRFITSMYESGNENQLISLDEVCSSLQVERRRLYDVVNVLEAFEVVVKKGKNQYAWFGLSRLASSIEKIEKFGSESFDIQLPAQEKLILQVTEDSLPFEPNSATTELDVAAVVVAAAAADATTSGKKPAQQSVAADSSTITQLRLSNSDNISKKTEKSLSLMTQKFMTLFFQAKDGVLGLEDAAAAMLLSEGFKASPGGGFDDGEMKKKIRRLYDIANILSSMRLISKIHLMDSRKPAFRWMRAEDEVKNYIAKGKEHEWFGITPQFKFKVSQHEHELTEDFLITASGKVNVNSKVEMNFEGANAVASRIPLDNKEEDLPPAKLKKNQLFFNAMEQMENIIVQQQQTQLSDMNSTLRPTKSVASNSAHQSISGEGILNQYLSFLQKQTKC